MSGEDEVVADFVGYLVRDKHTFDTFLENKSKGFIQRVIDVFESIIAYISSRVAHNKAIKSVIASLHDLAAVAAEAVEKGVKTEDEKARFSLQNNVSAEELAEIETIDEVNAQFNARLLELNDNRNAKNRVLLLGRPHKFLRDAGIADAEIEMEFDKFIRKSSDKYKHAHPFTAEDILDLPKAINAPIAVFTSTNGVDKVILTEIKKDGMNFIVTIKAVERKRKGGVILEVNEIETLYPKKSRGIISWINKELASNIDKEKALAWVEALRTNRETELTEQELNSATNIIQNFPNPNISTKFSLITPEMDAEEVVTNTNGDVDAIINKQTGQARLSLQCVDVSIMEHAEYIKKWLWGTRRYACEQQVVLAGLFINLRYVV